MPHWNIWRSGVGIILSHRFREVGSCKAAGDGAAMEYEREAAETGGQGGPQTTSLSSARSSIVINYIAFHMLLMLNS